MISISLFQHLLHIEHTPSFQKWRKSITSLVTVQTISPTFKKKSIHEGMHRTHNQHDKPNSTTTVKEEKLDETGIDPVTYPLRRDHSTI